MSERIKIFNFNNNNSTWVNVSANANQLTPYNSMLQLSRCMTLEHGID
jgi:hypothetical protein